MRQGYRNGKSFVVGTLLLLSACSKDKDKVTDINPPPVVTKTCRVTNYSTDEDLGGNGSQFAFSYGPDFNLVQVTAFQLNGYPGVTVKIGANGVNRDNGASILVWQYADNIYTKKPSVANFTLAATTTEKLIENYKYDSKNRLQEVDEIDVNTDAQVSRTIFTYDDNDNVTSVTFVHGPSGTLNIYYATKYDDHPAGYINIANREFMHWIDWWGNLTSNPKYIFDIMSAHNILEWTHNDYDASGLLSGTEKATFVYDFYTTEGRPQNRTESYYVNDQLKGTHKDVWSYADCN